MAYLYLGIAIVAEGGGHRRIERLGGFHEASALHGRNCSVHDCLLLPRSYTSDNPSRNSLRGLGWGWHGACRHRRGCSLQRGPRPSSNHWCRANPHGRSDCEHDVSDDGLFGHVGPSLGQALPRSKSSSATFPASTEASITRTRLFSSTGHRGFPATASSARSAPR